MQTNNGLHHDGVREYLSIVVHTTVSDRYTTTVAQITEWHKARGFDTIGYHKLINGYGAVFQGRADRLIGAGAEGWNEDSLHVALAGNGDLDKVSPADPQYKALIQVLAKLAKDHGIAVVNIIGHCEVYDRLRQPRAKTCPGKNWMALMPQIRAEVARYL